MSDQTEEKEPQAEDGTAPDETAVEDAQAEDVEKTEEQLAEEKAKKLKESIGITLDDIGTLRQRLTVTVPGEIIEERLDEQFSELQRERDVRGFRRGRAPRRLVEKAYGSEVRELLKEQIVSEAYLAATEKKAIQVLGDPDLDFDKIELPSEGDLEFSCEVEIKPEFSLPELKGIPVKKPTVTITDEDVDVQIGRLRMRFGTYRPVEDGEVKIDDLVVADVKMTVGDEVVHEEANAQFAARGSRIEGIVVEKLGDELAGAKVGDERAVEVTVADDHRNEDYRGKTAKFTFNIKDIRRLVLPPLNDEFAQMMGFENVAELKAMVRAESESRIDQEIQRGMRAQVMQYLADNTKLDVPAGLSDRQTQRVVQRRTVEMQRQGMPEAEIEKRVDELQTTSKEQAASEIRMFFILEKLAEEFDIQVSEDEINGQVAQMAQASGRRFDRVRDELMRRGALQALYVSLRDEKCIDRLLEDATISEVTPEAAEVEAEAGPEEAEDAGRKSASAKRKPPAKKAKKGEGQESEADLAAET